MSAPEIGGIIGERRDGVSDQGWWESRAAELMAERDALRAERDASLAGEVRIAQRLRAAKQRIARLQEALREVADHDEHRTDYECVIFMQETARNALSQDTESPQGGAMNESLESQVNRLAKFIMEKFPGEPSQDQGAVDTAIRLLSTVALSQDTESPVTSYPPVFRSCPTCGHRRNDPAQDDTSTGGGSLCPDPFHTESPEEPA